MKINRRTTITQNVKYLSAKIGVRYWVDCKYSKDNGETWIDPDDNDEDEKSVVDDLKEIIVPENQRWGLVNYWKLEINLDTGKVVDWPRGLCIHTYFKVCDDGEYVFLDGEGKEVVNITKEYDQYYVPDFLALEDEGYGDYVYLNIDGNGNIEHADWMRDRIANYFNDMNKDD